MTREDIESRLARLARETSALRAPADFAERVMSNVRAGAILGFEQQVARSARPVLVFAALLAIALLAASLSNQKALDRALATGADPLGAEW